MKTLRVTLADIIGPTGTPNSTATVHARYVDTSGRGRDVHLTDGTIVVPVRRTVAPGTVPQHFDFDVYANDVAPVREVDYGHLVEVSWTVVAPTGAKTSGVRRVAITDDTPGVVQLGLLATPTPVPPYTGGYVLPGELDALDARVVVLEEAPGGGGGGVTDHGALTGLGDDDHTQYHNDARGDVRYYTRSQVDALVSGSSGVNWGNLHAHATANMVFGNALVEPAVFVFVGDSITADGKWDEYFENRIAREYTPGTAKTHAKISYDENPWTRPTTPGIYGYDLAQNAVQSGAYMRSGLVVACVEDFQPQLIFHGIGSNDHIAGIAPATTTTNVDAACLALDAVLTLPAIHIIWAGMSPSDAGRTYPWQQRVEALKAAADIDPTRRMFVDFGPFFDALGTGTANDWWSLSGDSLHMETRAQYLFAELMHRALHGAPPVGTIGPAASPALPYSGTTTTTTTAATTTTTTTAAGTTTTTTTAEGTTTTTTTAATTTTTTTTPPAGFSFLQYERKTGTSANSHTFAAMSLGSEAAARTIIAAVMVDGHYLAATGTEVMINGVAATQDHAQVAGAKSVYVYRATVPTGVTGDVVVTLAGNNAKVSVGLWRASGAVTERTSAGHVTGATMNTTSGDFCVYGFIGGDTVTNCTERARSTSDSSIQIVADRVAPGGSSTATSGTGMAAAAGAAYYLTP